MNIFLLSSEIEKTLCSADRPEFNLMQRYEISGEDQKTAFVCALIGKVIEQNRMIRSGAGFATEITFKGKEDEQTNLLPD